MHVAKMATKNIGPPVNGGRKAFECTGTLALVAVASLTNKVWQLEYMTRTISNLFFE